MWRDIRAFTGSIAHHSKLVAGSTIVAAVGFAWGLYENLHFGPSLRALAATLPSVLFLLVAAFLAWKQERDARVRAEDAFSWQALADKFSEFSSAFVEASWSREVGTAERTWSIMPLAKDRTVQMCCECCRVAGKRFSALRRGPRDRKAEGAVDYADVWLDAIQEILEGSTSDGHSTVQVGEVKTEFEHGRIRKVGEASRLLCLRLAADDANFAGRCE